MRQPLPARDQIRCAIITAMFVDDELFERLTLKGGNALRLVYRIGGRTSLDLDFFLEGDFDDVADVEERLFSALRDRLDSVGYVMFDEQLSAIPPASQAR